jgi:hypothetical protein
MDKQLLKAYIRTIVEEEVQRILPNILGEAVSEIKRMQPLKESATSTNNSSKSKPVLDRARLAEMMGITYDGNTLTATTNSMPVPLPANVPPDVDPNVIKAVTKDYSALMKKMGIT